MASFSHAAPDHLQDVTAKIKLKPAGKPAQQKKREKDAPKSLILVPEIGIEPTTPSLRMTCSTN